MKARSLVLFFVFCIILSSVLIGCTKKQETLQESQEPLSIDVMSTTNASMPVEAKPLATPVAEGVSVPQGAPVTTAPSALSKPTNKEIQTALTNAGLYSGEIDGKIGPMSKKAIEEFQKAHNLPADGKVGPKTWGLLSAYLNSAAAMDSQKR